MDRKKNGGSNEKKKTMRGEDVGGSLAFCFKREKFPAKKKAKN